jgi:hypothetical protein
MIPKSNIFSERAENKSEKQIFFRGNCKRERVIENSKT